MSSYGRYRPRGVEFWCEFMRTFLWTGLAVVGIAAFVSSITYLFFVKNKICARYEEIKTVEDVDIGWHRKPTVVTRRACAEWKDEP